MSTKYTPAPWTILPEESDKQYIRIRGTTLGGRYKIANVINEKHDWTSSIIEDREHAESVANARLIASAPETAAERDKLKAINSELLEALRDMVESYQHEASSENPALLKAHAAIAKALGEQA